MHTAQDLEDISRRSRVISHFVTNFIAMATWVDQGWIQGNRKENEKLLCSKGKKEKSYPYDSVTACAVDAMTSLLLRHCKRRYTMIHHVHGRTERPTEKAIINLHQSSLHLPWQRSIDRLIQQALASSMQAGMHTVSQWTPKAPKDKLITMALIKEATVGNDIFTLKKHFATTSSPSHISDTVTQQEIWANAHKMRESL